MAYQYHLHQIKKLSSIILLYYKKYHLSIPNKVAKLVEDKLLSGGHGSKFNSPISTGILLDKVMLIKSKIDINSKWKSLTRNPDI